jgi:hypothetical protein
VRLFQNARYYPSLRPRIRELTKGCSTFAGQINAFLNFRESAAHILLPVDQRAEWAFFTNGDDEAVQRVWAREHGLSRRVTLGDILKAQMEEHRADVFYNLDATGWDANFIRSLPGCVRHMIAWHAAPFRNVSFTAYDLVVNNMPSILAAIGEQGCRTEHFFPAYDPEFASFAVRQDRPIDVVFVGGYSRHHRRRAETLEAVAKLTGEYRIVYHLDRSRLCRLAESPLGHLLPLAKHRRPPAIQAITEAPKFGLDYYEVLACAKIVLNGAIDISGEDRGNMRCFEALGAESLLLSDLGNYPGGMSDGQTIVTYRSPEHAVQQARTFLEATDKRLAIARAGHEMVSTRYSKVAQWKRFEALVASI